MEENSEDWSLYLQNSSQGEKKTVKFEPGIHISTDQNRLSDISKEVEILNNSIFYREEVGEDEKELREALIARTGAPFLFRPDSRF